MNKVFHIALREFLATVATKGFLIGILLTPALLAVLIVVMPRLMNEAPPRVIGEVAVIDPTGEVTAGVRDYLRPEKIAERREDFRKKIDAATPEAVKTLAATNPQARIATQQALQQVLGEVPKLDVVALGPSADLEQAKAPLLTEAKKRDEPAGRLALAVIHPDAVVRAAGQDKYGSYDLFVRSKLDDRLEDEIRDGLRESIVDARVRASGLDRAVIDQVTHVDRVKSTTVTAQGERKTNAVFNVLLPAGFMILLLVSVMTGGQSLMTTTVEEKSNRVVEVLLSAVSPMQLMIGKVLGQMTVGLLVLILYAGLGIVALISFAMLGLLDVKLLFFLLIFFLLSYFTIAALMAAIGAAVNEMREAQTLLTPVMMIVMLPWMLWMPITRDPGSTFATVASFVPAIGNFVMLLRMTSTSPPPMWQTWLSILIGAASAYAALWFAAKVFRIGLLMYGKPPTFGTLIRWVRMA